MSFHVSRGLPERAPDLLPAAPPPVERAIPAAPPAEAPPAGLSAGERLPLAAARRADAAAPRLPRLVGDPAAEPLSADALPSGRALAAALGALLLLVAAYVALHSGTTVDEAWGRPLSRGLQASIAAVAAAALAARTRRRRAAIEVVVVGYALVLFAAASILLHRVQWVPVALALTPAWAGALLIAARHRSRRRDTRPGRG